jgi:hypothetical protein
MKKEKEIKGHLCFWSFGAGRFISICISLYLKMGGK